jgi:hypothetical protein
VQVVDGEPKAEDGSTVHSLATVLVAEGIIDAYAFAGGTDAITEWITSKGSVIAGTDWTDDMFNPDADGIISASGGVAGGHCYDLDEYVPAGGALPSGKVVDTDFYGLHNSWSDSWGVGGRAYISVSQFAKLLGAQGEALTAIQVK